MKIDRKFRKTLSEIPNDCKQLIEKLKNCIDNDQLLNEICSIKSWNIGKCELYHWADVLDRFNGILEAACAKTPDPLASWQLACDMPENAKLKMLLLAVLQFTALLIEHSYSRHLYNSIEHLTSLLESTDFHVILSVLNLLYVFSKRSIFINRLSNDKKQALIQRLLYLAESWGGKENGLDLVKCCYYADLSNFPTSATSVNFEYTIDASLPSSSTTNQASSDAATSSASTTSTAPSTPTIQGLHSSNATSTLNSNKLVTRHVRLDKVHLIHENPAIIMDKVLKEHDQIPEDKRVLLYTYIRLAHSFPNYEKRKLFVQARLQSLSILVYSGAIQEHANNLLYDGLIEELVDVLTVKDLSTIPPFPEIKAASLKTLTAIIHLEKTNKLTEIIETTQAASYHGLLPTLVRKCVDHLIDPTKEQFPHQFATALFSFLYHLATYDTGGDALVKCGIMETLLKVVNHNHNSQEFIMFVTRAVRVIDLITNLDMSSFEAHNGLTAFINRLEYEINECRKEQPFVIKVKSSLTNTNTSTTQDQDEHEAGAETKNDEMESQETVSPPQVISANESQLQHQVENTNEDEEMSPVASSKTGLTCYHQRSALLKSILNFFKKVIADSSNNNVPNLGDSIRHMMEGSLPNSLKHIISNADYYGPSLFLLATDVVQLFIFQEPSQLSQLQENGLTDVILYALLKKNVPATREVLGSLPTVFSALCLNTNGLNAFIESKPFDKLFQVLLSPDYLPAMRRRRNADQANGGANLNATGSTSTGTATQLGNAMDELMRHQPSLRVEAMNSIIKLLEQLIEMGKNPNYICQKQSSSSSSSSYSSSNAASTLNTSSSRQTTSTSSQAATQPTTAEGNTDQSRRRSSSSRATNDTQQANDNLNTATASSTTGTAPTITNTNSDDEGNNQMEDYENAIMMVDSDTNLPAASSSNNRARGTSTTNQQSKKTPQAPMTSTTPPTTPECIPLLDYITNIMKFVEAILSNNSTDDHCKEFVKQKGLVPLLQILSLPNLPIDFPNSAACQSVAQVCKAILHLAREPQVIDQALNSLGETLTKCETLLNSYLENSKLTSTNSNGLIDGSVLIRELAKADNPLDACNNPQQTPLLHSISSVHSLIYLLITLGKINHNEVRVLTINKWGSDLGVKVLKALSKLYMNLVWESSMLLWLCNEEQQHQQLQQLVQLQQLHKQQNSGSSGGDVLAQTAQVHLAQLIQQLTNAVVNSNSTASSGLSNFEFNKSDLEKIKTFLIANVNPQLSAQITLLAAQQQQQQQQQQLLATSNEQTANSESNSEHQSEKMDVAPTPASLSVDSKPTPPLPSLQPQSQPLILPTPVVSYSKLLRPLFNVSSKLGRSLCELFGLLVKLSAASWKNTNTRRNNMIPPLSSNATPPQAAINVATAIVEISIAGFSTDRFLSSSEQQQQNLHPKFRLTFYICSIGFASSILFDEQKRPYHLMLQRFDQLGGIKALFDSFHWSLSLLSSSPLINNSANSASGQTNDELVLQQYLINQYRDKLQEGTLEFIEAWLSLINKLVNTKNVLETRHSLTPTPTPTSSSSSNNSYQQIASFLANLTGEVKTVCSFDPIKFLFKIHKESFEALMCLWENKSFIIRENYSLSETVLNILCQILIGDSQLQKKLQEQQQAQANVTSNQSASSTSSAFPSFRHIGIVGSSRANRPDSLPMSTTTALSQLNAAAAAISVDQNAAASTATPQQSSATPTRQLTSLDQEIIHQMIGMGFSPELAREAVMRSPPNSLEQAVEYCFSHPTTTNNSADASNAAATSSSTTSNHEPATPVIEQAPSNQANPTESLMIDNETTTSTTLTPQESITKAEDPIVTPSTAEKEASSTTSGPFSAVYQLDKDILDKFASNMLPGLMKILDNVPDCVYRVCDLIVVVIKKYGDEWRDNCLLFILNETCDLIREVGAIYAKAAATSSKSAANSSSEPMSTSDDLNSMPVNPSFIEQKLASRLLLFCLLFEEMQLPCAKIVNTSNLLDKLVTMLQMITTNSFNLILTAKQSLAASQDPNTSALCGIPTPVWLTSLFILIDLIEKAALATKRKAAINEQFSQYQRVWKWYEERQNRWVAYATNNNKVIDNAYKNGDTSVRIVASRKHYLIHFNTMLQENEETLHKRPVMLTFEKSASTVATTTTANQQGNSTNTTAQQSSFGSDNNNILIDNNAQVSLAPSSNHNQPPASTTTSSSRPSSPLPTEIVNGLESSQIIKVIESCVELISWPVSDPDCLHAILRLILRLTRQYEYAIEFAARRGPHYILQLTQRNSFMGYASLITLIFRHICEDEKNLRLTMEKAIRLALTGSQVNIAGLQPGGIGSKELHNVLRLLGPAICRHPDLFCQVACDILRIMIRREDEQFINTSTNLTMLSQPIKQQLTSQQAYCLRTVAAKLMPTTSMPDYARELVVDLLNYLIKPTTSQHQQQQENILGSKSTSNTKINEVGKTDTPTSSSKHSSKTSNSTAPPLTTAQQQSLQQQVQPLISKSGVLRILSELVRSYAGCAKIIAQHVYKLNEFINLYQNSANNSPIPPIFGQNEECNALAFLLDNLLASNQTFGDKDCPSLCRLLIVALASCNHCLDSQNALVHEVKQALNRAISLPESNDKYVKIQAFASIINTMIETCPPIQNVATAQQQQFRSQPPNVNLVNNMMKIMHKKGLINDLSRVPYYMDLSSLKSIDTINTILKPLETMTKTLNISVRKQRNDILFPKSLQQQAITASATNASASSASQAATATTANVIEPTRRDSTQTASSQAATTQPVRSSQITEDSLSSSASAATTTTTTGQHSLLQQHHSGVTSDVAGLNLAADTNIIGEIHSPIAISENATSALVTCESSAISGENIASTGIPISTESSDNANAANVSNTNEDLNMTEMEPQQTLPQDVDMLPTTAGHHHHHHHHGSSRRRDYGERVFDRVIEALHQEVSAEDDSDSDSDGYGNTIHIDNGGNQIHIQIETADDEDDEDDDEEGDEEDDGGDDDDDDDDDDDGEEMGGLGNNGEEAVGGVAAVGLASRSSGDDDDGGSATPHLLDGIPSSVIQDANDDDESDSSSSDDDEDGDEDDQDDDDDDDDEDENVIDEELVEGSDGRSAVDSELESDDGHNQNQNGQNNTSDILLNDNIDSRVGVNSSVVGSSGAVVVVGTDDTNNLLVHTNEHSNGATSLLDATSGIAANGGVVTTTSTSSIDGVTGAVGVSGGVGVVEASRANRRRRHRRHPQREQEIEEVEDEDEEDEEEDEDDEEDLPEEDEDEEDMELDDGENEIIEDDQEIIEEDEEEEEENEEDEEEEDEDEEEENEEEDDEDATSEYYDAYNQMLDFINEDNGEMGGGNGDDDEFLTHIENLWHTNGHNAQAAANANIVLGHHLGLSQTTNNHRNYPINFLGSGFGALGGLGGSGLGPGLSMTSSNLDGTLPPHPLSVSAVHPLLVHHRSDGGIGSSSSNITGGSSSNLHPLSSNGIIIGSGLGGTGGGLQISGLGMGGSGTNVGVQALASLTNSLMPPIFRNMRTHIQQATTQQQPATSNNSGRPYRVSRFVLPGVQLQLTGTISTTTPTQPGSTSNTNQSSTSSATSATTATTTNQTSSSTGTANASSSISSQTIAAAAAAAAVTLPTIRHANLPYNTLNEILQGFETPASALQPPPPPTIITAPSATSFLELLTGITNQHANIPHTIQPVSSVNNSSNAALASLNNQEFLVNLNSYSNDGFGENIGNGTTNLYIIRTPLARWNEECTVLDSHSMHHAILLNKPIIMEALEKHRNDELNEKREKKLKEEKEKQKRQQQAAATTAASSASTSASANKDTPLVASTQPEPSVTSNNEPVIDTISDDIENQTMAAASETIPSAASSNSVQQMEAEEIATTTADQTSTPASQAVQSTASGSSTLSAQEITTSVEHSSSINATDTTETSATTTAAATTATNTTSPFTTQAEREAATNFLINFVGATCTVFTIASQDERRIAIEALRMADHHRASLELQAATTPNENSTTNIQFPANYVFLDGHVVEIPTGIDPSFLSALPDSLRREVIMEQLRIQGIDIRNRPIPASSTPAASNVPPATANTEVPSTASAAVTAGATSSNATIEINPEFLAALPPQIQEELLTQQRIEQQQARAAAAASDGQSSSALATTGAAAALATGDDDNTAFLRALPSSLRQAILFDMDHSQISALPEDLATEARALQQHREREIDLFANAAHRSGSGRGGGLANPYGSRYTISANRGGLGGIYNVATSLLHDSYFYSGSGGRDLNRLRRGLRHLNDADLIFNAGGLNLGGVLGGGGGGGPSGPSGLVALEKSRNGRQLLDHESLACLLVLLFIDDPRLNMTKLHRVVKNLCLHSPTRAWVIKALLCILEKVSGKQLENFNNNQLAIEGNYDSSMVLSKSNQKSSRQASKSPSTAASNDKIGSHVCQPSWLTMSIDGPFGSKTNVFTITKPVHKKSLSQSKLTPMDQSNEKSMQLMSANQQNNMPAISINSQACPAILKQILEILSTLARDARFSFFPRIPFPTTKQNIQQQPHQQSSKSHFWDIIVKLDQSKNKSKLSQSAMLASTTPGVISELDAELDFTIENSPLARLMSMLDYPVLKNNPNLMDKMFTCLSQASSGIPQIESANKSAAAAAAALAGVQASNAATISTTGTATRNEQTDQQADSAANATLSAASALTAVSNVSNEPVLNKQIELVVNVLKNKLCTQDGLQQAYALLNNLSKINPATRNMIIQHLLRGTRELGLAVCKEIDTLMDEAVKYTNSQANQQPADELMEASATQANTSSIMASYAQTSSSRPSTSTATQQQNLIDSYSNLVISSPKTKQTRELQLPSMSLLVEKNSNQKFFVRLIRLIISLRETIEKEAKKKKTAAAAAATAAASAVQGASTTTASTAAVEASAGQPSISGESQSATIEDQETTSSEAKKQAPAVTPPILPSFELPRLSAELDLDILWNKLSSCLTVLKSLSDPYAVLILQQTVEGFFYVHATRKDKDEKGKRERETKETQLAHLDTESQPMSPGTSTSTAQSGATTSGNTMSGDAKQKDEIAAIINSIGNETSLDTKRFLEFALTHRTVLNHILRQTSNNLSEEPYSVLVDFTRSHTHILDFDVKRRYFRQELDKLKDSIRGEDLAVHVRRTNIFDDSYRELNRRSTDDWKHRFYIVFEGEEGQDAGGLLREWYMIISKEIFNPDYALFMINPGDRVTYMPNPSSHCNPNHLSYFKFIGHIIAKAIFDNKFLDCYFTRAFYKHILGVPVKYTDMESVDNEFYKNLCSILESDIDTFGVDLYFSIDINEFGVTQSRDLKPNGRNLKVTNENKQEYVRLVCQEKMIGSIRQQVSSFLQGFYEIIPKSLISIFNEQELELLISGLPEIDLEDLRRNTEYHKYTTNSLQIQWFWRALKSFDKEDQAKFLQFVTGTSKVPLQGFSKLEGMNGPQKFQIHRDDRDTSRLPCAHTCFNQLDLPAYENYEKLRTMLLMSIRECSTGFGLA